MCGLRYLSGVAILLVMGAFSKLALAENGSSLLGQPSLPTASAVIKAIASAPALVDYEGTKVITAVRDGRVETITVLESHKRPGSLRLEYLSPESVSGRLIIDDGTTAWQYEPSLHAVVQGPSFANKAIDTTLLTEGLGHYAVTVEDTEEVIGRETVVLALSPAATGLSRRLWVDRATGVILRSEERTARDGIVFTAFFTRISYSLNLPAPLFDFRLPAGARSYSFYFGSDLVGGPQQLQQQVGFSIRAPTVLPLGYRYRQGTVTRSGPVLAATTTYDDGVSSVTVFQTPTSRMGLPKEGERIRLPQGEGRVVDLGHFRMLMWESHGMRMAAVGPLPAAELAILAQALDAASP